MAIYVDLIKLLLKQAGSSSDAGASKKLLEEAFQVTELSRSRSFLETLAESRGNQSFGIPQKMKEEEQRILSGINAVWRQLREESSEENRIELSSKLQSLEQRFKAFKDSVRLKEPRYATFNYPQPLSLAEVQKCLDPGTLLLEYVLAEPVSFLFVVGPNSCHAHLLPSQTAIQEQMQKVRTLLASPAPYSPSRPLAELCSSLLSGVDLPEEESLIVSPDDVLHYLPFETLVLANGKYLIEEHPISYISSGTMNCVMHNEKKNVPSRPLIAFGNPGSGNDGSYREKQFRSEHAPLSFSGKEVKSVSGLFEDSVIHLGLQATEEQMRSTKLDKFRYIHFATHALIDEQVASRSRIVLSSDLSTASDGYLDIHEIQDLQVNAELVVLSACATSLGEFVRGEGLIGMTKAWFYAGASSVIASLWYVNDRSTALLMEKMYTELSNGVEKSEALRQAKLWMLSASEQANYRHPYYWAPFVLHGDPR